MLYSMDKYLCQHQQLQLLIAFKESAVARRCPAASHRHPRRGYSAQSHQPFRTFAQAVLRKHRIKVTLELPVALATQVLWQAPLRRHHMSDPRQTLPRLKEAVQHL